MLDEIQFSYKSNHDDFSPRKNVEDYPVGLLAPLNAIGTSLQVINSLQWASPSHDHCHDHGDDGNVIMKT